MPFHFKKATRKINTEYHISGYKSWLYDTIWIIFSDVFNFFEPHLPLLCYENIKIFTNGHFWINLNNKCKFPGPNWKLINFIPFNTKDMVDPSFKTQFWGLKSKELKGLFFKVEIGFTIGHTRFLPYIILKPLFLGSYRPSPPEIFLPP